MASKWGSLSFVAISLLAIACESRQSPLAEAAASLERAGAYRVEYQLTTSTEGTAKPVVASGVIDFEGAGRWRTRQDSMEIEAVGPTVHVRAADTLRVEEMVELPVHPLLYLKSAVDVKRSGGSEGNATFSLTVDRGRYRESLEQALGVIPPALAEVVDRFSGSGEVTLDAGLRPLSMRLHLRDSSVMRGETRQELDVRFLGSSGDYPVQAPAGTGQSKAEGGAR